MKNHPLLQCKCQRGRCTPPPRRGRHLQVPPDKGRCGGLIKLPDVGCPSAGQFPARLILSTMASMDIEWIRNYCLSLPHTTEDIQWESLLFRIARKIYVMVSPDGTGTSLLCFKCTPEEFAELVEMEGVIPAPYLARNHW